MTPKWQKLASLAQEICTLYFQFFGAVFASKDTLLRTYMLYIWFIVNHFSYAPLVQGLHF